MMKRLSTLLLAVLLAAVFSVPAYALDYDYTTMYVLLREAYARYDADYPYQAVYWSDRVNTSSTTKYVTIIYSKTPVIQQGDTVVVVSQRNDNTLALGNVNTTYQYMYYYNVTGASGNIEYARPICDTQKPTGATYGYCQYYVTNLSSAKTYDHASTKAQITYTWEITKALSLPGTAALQATIDLCAAISDVGYTPASWALLQQRLQEARDIIARGYYSATTLNTANTNLLNAKNGLALAPNPAALQALIDECAAMENIGYTPGTWNVLQGQIAAARNLIASGNYTQAQLDAQKTSLQNAKNALKLLPDTSELRALLSQCEAVENTGYTPTSWYDLQMAISKARNILALSEYTAAQVAEASAALGGALAGLTEQQDTAFLESQLKACKAIPNDGYTPTSWNALQDAIRDAESLLARDEYTAEEVQAALSALIDARRGLSYLPDSGGLWALITSAAAIENKGYTPASWNNLQAALAAANALLSGGSYTDTELGAAAASLNAAVNGLQASPPDLPSTPEGHRYLIDGVLPGDLSIAQDAIFENIGWGRGAGLWAFGLMFAVYIAIRVVRSWVGIQGEARYIDLNSPGTDSYYDKDILSGGVSARNDKNHKAVRGIR